MTHRQMHLSKGQPGMAARTACGRNVLRTPMSTNWAAFSSLPADYQCAKCAASKQAEFFRRKPENGTA